MKVLYDYRVYNIQKFGGVSRYFCELIKCLEENKKFEWDLPIKYSDNEHLNNLHKYGNTLIELSGGKDFLPGFNFKGKQTIYKLRNRFFNKRYSIKSLAEGKYSLFHPTYYDDYFLPYLGSKPFVITVHDMTHELYPQYFPDRSVIARKKKLVKKASKIIAISDNTKKDLVNILNVPEEKIEVIYLGNSLYQAMINNHSTHLKLPAKYLLFVGRRSTYKNFNTFIISVRDLLLRDKTLHIICTGSDFTKEEWQLFRRLNVEHKIIYYPSNDDILAHLYKNALAFVFPSLYEGFGLPVLEAFSCGCPCILSNRSSLPEIGGHAAMYFDPENSQSIQTAVTSVISDEELRQNLIKHGYQQAKQFSWEETARQTYALYQSIV